MWTDVVDLREFYEGSTGQVARRMIRRTIRTLWPDVKGESLLGLGYATPYLRPFRGEAERIAAVMPAGQGVLHWPPEGPGVVALADEGELPLPDLSIDRVLLVHALEHTEQIRRMLREVWRVMAGGGRLLVVVPNRRGIWARLERTPFGHGRPYSDSQLSRLLRDNMFTPMRSQTALFVPPSRSRMILGSAAVWEKAGARWFQPISGVILVEASKQIYAGTTVGAVRRREKAIVPVPRSSARVSGPTRSRLEDLSL
ncbi:MAG: methyltransferase domain-containing protein [Alphaproteobacteria bacterium]|nr:methyltransferase domain-containing protein [Alphaproteobacteria bacterium]